MCQNEGARLFEIKSPTQNDKLADYAIEIVGEGRNFWQGLTDTETDGVWTFVSDSSNTDNYAFWGGGQPFDDDNKDCATMYTSYPSDGE